MYKVIIIEDDPMVASINRQYVDVTPAFSVDRVFKNGAEALEYLKNHGTDLIVLDYYTPVMNGDEFIDRLHALGKYPAIIMVTSANDTDIVHALLNRGVMDYLVKPFDYDRFKTALERYQEKRLSMEQKSSRLSQDAIDQLIAGESSADSSKKLSKGLNDATLSMVRNFLRDHPTESFTSEQVAEAVNLSRITIRRYLNYLVDTHEIVSTIDYKTGGRPSIRYRLV